MSRTLTSSTVHRAEAPPQAALESVVISSVNRADGATGVHTHTRALREGLIEAGVRCEEVSPFSGSAAWLPVFAVRRPLRMLSRTWGLVWYRHWHLRALHANLVRRLRRGRVDALVAQCPLSAEAALAARAETGLGFGIAMVCHFNQSEAIEYREQGELPDQGAYEAIAELERRVMERVDDVIYVSNWSRDAVERTRGIRPRRSHVIWNGIAEATHTDGGPTRQSLGLSADDIVLISVGTLEPRKNQLALVEMFAQLAPKHPRAKLVLVGEGPLRADIETRIRAANLADRVHLLGYRRDVPALLMLSDIYVHSAKLENCPVSLIEAARAGLPFAAATGGGIAELATVLQSGVTLDVENLAASAAAIEPLLGNAELRKELGERGRENFHLRFTQQAMVEAYRRVLGAPR